MNSLNAYIPMDRRLALTRGETLPERAQGTALFTDISEFTPLTAVFAEEMGPQRGAEALTHHLNKIYGALIDVVHQYRGSVVGFSGDGITCWFDGDNGLRGAAAAYGIQQVIEAMGAIITPSGKNIPLGIKTAVAAGTVNRFLVGDSEINYIDVLAGKLPTTLAAIEQSLSRGDIGIDLSVVPVLEAHNSWNNRQQTKEGRSYCLLTDPPVGLEMQPWPKHVSVSTEIARQWLLPPVLKHLESGQAQFLAELRPVVAMFINFGGIDYDNDETVKEKLDAFVQCVQKKLARYEGHLLELTIGDKGNYIYAVFGAIQAHEDDADRALHAARDLLKASADFDYIQTIQIGLSQGQMRTGAYGSTSRRAYGVQGFDVNLAARLMTHAKSGQILVSKHLAEASRSEQFSFQEVGEIQFKGISKAVATYLVLDKETDWGMITAVSGDIVGRDSERFLFNQYLFSLRNGESNLVLVEGIAGIGKSYLIADLLKTAKSRNFIYLYGAGDAVGQATPYHAWREVIHRLLGVPMAAMTLDAPQKQRLQQQVLGRLHYLDPDLVFYAPLLNVLLPLDFPEDAQMAQMSEVARADNLHDLVIRLLQETAVSTPLLLVFEDAHLIDSASSALLRLVQRAVSPLLIVVATRPLPAPFPTEYTRLLNHPDTYHMVLGTLPKDAINKLVCKRLGVKSLPQPVTQLIHEKAEGHPFFSEELAYALRDAHIIQIEGSVCQLMTEPNQLTEMTFPDTIQGVIISRLDRLSPQLQSTLKVASVIGRLFAFQILHDVHPDHESKKYLKSHIVELEQLDITMQESPEPDLAYIFKHIITQEVTYNLMTFEQRQLLHRKTAEVYELIYAADLSAAFELLAYHWSKAEETEKAIYYLERAGEQALKNAANAEVVYFFTQALTLDKEAGFISGKDRRAQWELMSGIAYVNWSRYQKGLEHLDAGLTLLDKPRPKDAILKKAGRTIQQILRQDLFKIHTPPYEKKSAKERETLLAASRAYARLVEVDYHLGDIVGSVFDSFYALNLAEEAGPSSEYAEAAAPVGIFWGLLPWRSRAESYLDRALKTAEKAENNEVLSYALMVKGTYEAGVGQWADAQTRYKRIIALNKQFASRRLNDGYHHLSRVYYLQGRYEDSWKTAVSLINSAKKLNDQRFEAYGIQCQAYILLYQGRLQEALNNLETLYELFSVESKIDDEQMELDTYGLLALVHLRLGNLEKAFQIAGLAVEIASPFPSGYYNLPGYANSAEVYLSLWEQNYVESSLPKLTQHACNALNKYARIFTIGKPRSYLLQGRFAWQKGKKRKAYKVWQKGLVVAERLKMPYEQGCLHYEIGHHANGSAERAHHLKQAQTIFEALGARYELNRLKSD